MSMGPLEFTAALSLVLPGFLITALPATDITQVQVPTDIQACSCHPNVAANVAALAALLTFRRHECTEYAVIDTSHHEEAVIGGRMTVTLNLNSEVCAIQKAGCSPKSDPEDCNWCFDTGNFMAEFFVELHPWFGHYPVIAGALSMDDTTLDRGNVVWACSQLLLSSYYHTWSYSPVCTFTSVFLMYGIFLLTGGMAAVTVLQRTIILALIWEFYNYGVLTLSLPGAQGGNIIDSLHLLFQWWTVSENVLCSLAAI